MEILIEGVSVNVNDFMSVMNKVIELSGVKAIRDSDDFKETSKWRVLECLRGMKGARDERNAQNWADHCWFIVREAFNDELIKLFFYYDCNEDL